MLRLINEIRIYKQPDFDRSNPIVYRFVNNVETDESWDDLTDTCTIVLPKKATTKQRTITAGEKPLFTRGDKVDVYLGYYPKLELVFSGYINTIGINTPIELELEDEMFTLKRTLVKQYSANDITLDTLMKNVLPASVKYVAVDETIEIGRAHV